MMQFILILPFDVALILFLFCLIAPFVLTAAIVSVALPYVGFLAMCLLTLQIYIWALTPKT